MSSIGLIKQTVFKKAWEKSGYSPKLAKAYCRTFKKSRLSKHIKDWSKDKRYLLTSIEKYGADHEKYISDIDYLFLLPVNNSFSKWFKDKLTVNNILVDFRDCLPKLYLNIISREKKKIYLPADSENVSYDGVGFDKLVELFDEHKKLALRPTYYNTKRYRYLVERIGEGKYTLCYEHIGMPEPEDKAELSEELLEKFISSLEYDLVVTDPYKLREGSKGTLRLYVGSRTFDKGEVLDAYIMPYGTYDYVPLSEALPEDWDRITERVSELATFVSEVDFFSCDIVLTEDGFFINRFNASPWLPGIAHSEKLNDYLMYRLKLKQENVEGREKKRRKTLKRSLFRFYMRNFCRPGMRPYMQKLWLKSVWDDLLHTKNVGFFKKLWCHRHGFLSYRTYQYGLTRDNYKDFLSDYQYHWLNRINNGYQIWINDKLTTRYILEPNKQYLAKYYFVIAKRNYETGIKTLQDIPEGFDASFDSIFRLLEQEKLLALKPSSGTHGDGFYRMEYADGKYLINGDEMSREEIIEMICGFKSIYIITEYLFMHKELRKIYPHSVNTIRVAAVNQYGNEPKIMQTYMRIGSSKSGFTDNVGYGGICAKIDIPTGRYYCPQQIHDHVFTPCPIHPDTGVEIEGIVPNWDCMCKGVKDICRSMPELEYLGFDIAITDDGFKIIEINIHQDLHKVAEHSDEFKAFYRDKLRLKAERYGLKKW